MKDLFSGGAVIVLIIAVILIVPVLFLWSVNSLAEAGGSQFYINHTLWNYFLALVFVGIIRGK